MFDVAFFVRTPDQAEVMLEQVVAFKPEKLAGYLALARAENLGHGNLAVVVADPSPRAAEELKCSTVAFLERLGTFTRERLNEKGVRIGQRHHEQSDLLAQAVQIDLGEAKIDLGFAHRMR